MPTTLILYFMFQEKDFKVITWVSIKYCEFSPFYKIKLSIFTLYGNQMNRISLSFCNEPNHASIWLLFHWGSPSPHLPLPIFSISCSFFCDIWLNCLLDPPPQSSSPLPWGIPDPLLFSLQTLSLVECITGNPNCKSWSDYWYWTHV